MNPADTPLLDAMLRYAGTDMLSFHTPGHKQGRGAAEKFAQAMQQQALVLDMYEIDDLHEPHGCIREAQEQAARLYGADHSFFVINGTTGGIYAMIMAVAGPGEKIIVPRNVHRSVVGGLIFSGALPVYVQPEVDTQLGVAMGVTPAAVKQALDEHPDAKAVLMVYPTYYGVASDLRQIADITHRHGIPLLVDEAHGPHLKFCSRLPVQALDAGADITAQSTHKILGAMSQCSMVHCRKGRIDLGRLKTMLKMVQSTSPSFPLLASLDAARAQMAVDGEHLMERTVELAEWARCDMNRIPGLYAFGAEKVGQPGVHALDPTKLTVTVTGLGITGTEAEDILRREYKIQAELSDVRNVLFLITLADGRREAAALTAALSDLALRHRRPARLQEPAAAAPPLPAMVLSPRQALFSRARAVPFDTAAGRISAEMITFYPPGIPVLCPGEGITDELIGHCRRMQAAGLHVSGPEDNTLTTVKVVETG